MNCARVIKMPFPSIRRIVVAVSILNAVAIAGGSDSVTAQEPEFAGARLTLLAGGDAPASDQNRIVSPFGIGFDARGTLFFVEMTGHRLRRLGTAGQVTTLAGSGARETAVIRAPLPTPS